MTARPIVIVDYHKGNLRSVERGLVEAGGTAVVTDDPAAIAAADALVLPGVGSFGDAAAYLGESGQREALLAALGRGVPFLGICLGLQLLFERGSETDDGSWAAGLGVMAGSATRLESTRLKVPHVGWDQLDLTPLGRSCPLFADVAEGAHVYFTHSYALADDVPAELVAARTHYARSFASAAWDGANTYGVQFHPEKSSAVGLQILRSFVRLAGGAA
ncbi:MAG: imidazole glycerol phosphate synthase subunit HisH [Atopobiaceae bacterium]|nr:imidazole glycerol phosphate synthase subunit HisH [Atopobiaceae bacterium]